MIRVNVDIIRAQIERQSIFAFDRTCSGALDYEQFIEELTAGNIVQFPKQRRVAGGGKG